MYYILCILYIVFLPSVLRLLVTANVVPSSLILVTLPKRWFLQDPHGITSEKTPFFIVTTVKTPCGSTQYRSFGGIYLFHFHGNITASPPNSQWEYASRWTSKMSLLQRDLPSLLFAGRREAHTRCDLRSPRFSLASRGRRQKRTNSVALSPQENCTD
jgi:hypothetical protein